jgi:hypothetical protein
VNIRRVTDKRAILLRQSSTADNYRVDVKLVSVLVHLFVEFVRINGYHEDDAAAVV